jgi:transcription elongation GreA/GreB family factor
MDTSKVSLPPYVEGKKSVGQRVTYRVVPSGETETRTIVAVRSALDRAPDEITTDSPKAKALEGHTVGDRGTVEPFFGKPPFELEILSIDQPSS